MRLHRFVIALREVLPAQRDSWRSRAAEGAPRLVNCAVALAVTVVATLAGGLYAPASAATGNILPPFTVGEQWYIYQGYNSGTHVGTSAYGLDLTVGTSTTSTSGRTVRAPMAGTIYYWDAPYGNLCINTPNGRSYTMTHINPAKTSGTVTAGQVLGTVAAAGQAKNNGVAHLHFEFWSGPGCYNQSTPLPFASAHGLRICGAPDLTATGPNAGNGTWSKTYFTGQTCSTSYNPQGHVDAVSSSTPGTVYVRGWAFDKDAPTTAIKVHAYVGGPAGTGEGHDLGLANVSRPDVGKAYPGTGDNHGFNTTFSTKKTGTQPVYLYAINVGGGSNKLIGQGTATIAKPDTTPPDTTITSVGTSDSTATVAFAATEAGSTFQCSVAGSAWATCASPMTVTLAPTPTAFSVRARDKAGNTDASPAVADLPAATTPTVSTEPPPVSPTSTKPRVRAKVKVVVGDRIVIDANPNWSTGKYRVRLKKKTPSGWRTVKRATTRGARDVVALDPRRGTFRVVVRRTGFRPYTSTKLRLRR